MTETRIRTATPSPARPLLDLSGVGLSYPAPQGGLRGLFSRDTRDRRALEAITLSVAAGDRLALVGLNGSGKSTLLRVMAGIFPPSRGNVAINGRVAALFSLGIGMKIELTGRRNILLQGLVHGLTPAETEALTPEIIAFSGLGAVIDDPVNTYSQGMAVRLSFAIATAVQPDILLLDEWIGAGDRVFREKAQARLVSMVEDARALVLASHNVHIVRNYCNRALWLHDGRVQMLGDVEDVIEAFEAATDNAADANVNAVGKPGTSSTVPIGGTRAAPLPGGGTTPLPGDAL